MKHLIAIYKIFTLFSAFFRVRSGVMRIFIIRFTRYKMIRFEFFTTIIFFEQSRLQMDAVFTIRVRIHVRRYCSNSPDSQ